MGGLYACIAISFSLIWGVTNLINLAHGSMIILGAYITWLLHTRLGVDPFLTLPASAAALFAFGYALQRLLLNRVLQTSLFMTLILTFGLNMLLVNVNLARFTADVRSITMPYAGLSLQAGDIRLPYTRIAVFVIALSMTLALHLFLKHSRTGQSIRATASNARAASALGIDTRAIHALTFGIGAAMAGAAGSLVAVLYAFSPVSGDALTLLLAGTGSVFGPIAGAFFIEFLATLTWSNLLNWHLGAMGLVVMLIFPEGVRSAVLDRLAARRSAYTRAAEEPEGRAQRIGRS